MARRTAKARQEVELKLELPPDEADRLIGWKPFVHYPKHRARLKSTYYDTPGLDLRRAGYSLRVRKDGQHFVQTLKQDSSCAGLFSRIEWEQEVVDPRCSVRGLTGTGLRHKNRLMSNLLEQVNVDVDRRTWMLEDSGTLIEAALDRGVVRTGRKRAQLTELELELKRGSPDQLFTLARQLAAAFPLRVAVLSKAERGFRLNPDQSDFKEASSPKLSREMSVSEAFPAIITSCITSYRLNEALFSSNPTALHQGRVALRRLRVALSLFRRAVADGRYRDLRDDVNRLANALGTLRDLDVFCDRYGQGLSKRERERVRNARSSADRAMQDAVGSQRARTLMIDLVGWSVGGSWRRGKKAQQSILRYARRELNKHWQKVRARGRKLDELDQAGRHRLRIEIKKLRYATEFLGSLFTARRVRAFRTKLAIIQDLLGELNDQIVAQQIAKALSLAQSLPALGESEPQTLRDCGKHFTRLKGNGRFWQR